MNFRSWYDQRIIKAKRKIKVIILGSYEAKKRLESVRDHLRESGYTQAYLVANYAYPPREAWESEEEYYYRKSEYAMAYGDILLFIFFDKVNNEGVTVEISHIPNLLPNKIPFSTVLIEESYQQKLSSMVKGLIKTHKFSYKFFKDDEELKELAFGSCSQHLHKLLWSQPSFFL